MYFCDKSIYKYSSKYVQKVYAPNCENEVNYIVDHALNFKQQIVDCIFKCLNRIEKC